MFLTARGMSGGDTASGHATYNYTQIKMILVQNMKRYSYKWTHISNIIRIKMARYEIRIRN